MASKGMRRERVGVTKQRLEPNRGAQLSEESEHVPNGSEQVANRSEQLAKEIERLANGQVSNGSEQLAKEIERLADGQVSHRSELVSNGRDQATNVREQVSHGNEQLAKGIERITRGSEHLAKESEQLTTDFFQSINEALTPRRTLPGFADPRVEHVNSIELPPWFIDRCRRAYLSVPFDAEAECRVLGVTSAFAGEGKTSVAIGIATAMAVDTKKPTLLLECDFAEPSFYKFFGINAAGGLSEWLDGGSRLRIVRGAAYAPNVFVIPSGAAQSEPARYFYELMDRNVLEGLRGCFGNVVIDLPPTLNLSYASLAYALVDRLLIVARSRVTLTNDLERLVNRIGKDRVSGIVLNGTDYRTPRWLRPLL
jgi:Mrp family chromosome partitioning ATPase